MTGPTRRPGFAAWSASALAAAALTLPGPTALTATVQGAELAAFAPALAELPPGERAGATLYARGAGGRRLVRRGAGVHICLGDVPGDDSFSATCYHRTLDPLVLLEERLSAEGLPGDSLTARIHAELDAGRLVVPWGAYEVSVSGPIDADTGRPAALTIYHLLYTPGASAADIGLPAEHRDEGPFVHHAGRYDAHVMWSEVRSPG